MPLSKKRNSSRQPLDQQHFDEIFKPAVLQQRLQLLRKTYDMSLDEMSHVSVVFSRSTLHTWETGISIPAIDGLLVFAVKFGVSLDWLSGASDVPYTAQFIDFAEDKYFAFGQQGDKRIEDRYLQYFDLMSPAKFDKAALERYCSRQTRIEFPLEARANVLVLLRLPNAISNSDPTEDSMSMSQSGITFDSQKKQRKYFKAIDDLKTVINTGKPVYKLFGK